MKKLLIAGFLSLILVQSVQAGEPDFVFTSPRQMAMGGVCVAVANDINALYQNPACLSQLSGFKLTAFQLNSAMNNKTMDGMDQFMNLFDMIQTRDKMKIMDAFMDMIPSEYGASIAGSALSIGWPGFGLGFFTQSNLNVAFQRPSAPQVTATGFLDAAGMAGMSSDLDLGGLQVAGGITAKTVFRARLYDPDTNKNTMTLTMGDIINAANGEAPDIDNMNGMGFGFDVGALTKLTTPIGDGKLGVVVHNLGTQLIGQKSINGAVATGDITMDVDMTAAVGVGIVTRLPEFVPLLSDLGNFTLGVDYKFISNDTSVWKNLNVGIEKSMFADMVQLRGGLHQGFVVGGLGINFLVFHLDYAYWAEALGSEINIGKADYQVVQMGLYF